LMWWNLAMTSPFSLTALLTEGKWATSLLFYNSSVVTSQ
jgi:hypothetical protein